MRQAASGRVELKSRETGTVQLYTIVNLVGEGSTCLAYEVTWGTHRGILKECWPARELDIFRGDDGHLCINESARADFADAISKMERAYEKSAAFLFEHPEAANYMVQPRDILETPELDAGRGTVYVLQAFDNGTSLAENPPKTAHEVFGLALSAARALKIYHSNNQVYLDLKPGNLFVFPPGEKRNQIKFYDLDAAQDLDEIYNGDSIFRSTMGWEAPEMRQVRKNPGDKKLWLNLDRRADFYLVGCLVDHYLGTGYRACEENAEAWEYPSENEILKNINPAIRRCLQRFFEQTLCGIRSDRYALDDKLISALEELEEKSEPKLRFIIPSFTGSRKKASEFIGRGQELADIAKLLKAHSTVFLHGFGGIGKSETALQYIARHKGEFDTIVQVFYQNKLSSSLMTHVKIANFEPYGENEDEKYGYFYNELSKLCNARTLLLVENFNTTSDPHLPDLLKLPCKKIITTRSDYGLLYSKNIVKIWPDDNMENLKKIFYLNAPPNNKGIEWTEPETDAQVKSLICTVNHHTLTVILLAKQLAASYFELSEILQKLKSVGVDGGYTSTFEHNRDDIDLENTAYGHVSAIFDMNSLEPDALEHLKVLTYIPPNGIEMGQFLRWCGYEGEEGVQQINNLVRDGWVDDGDWKNRGTGAGLRVIHLHPVISEVLWHELKPSLDDGRMKQYAMYFFAFLNNENITSRKKERYLDYAGFFVKRIRERTEKAGDILGQIGIFYDAQGHFLDALKCAELSLEICTEVLPSNHPNLAKAYNIIGAFHISLGQDNAALNFLNLALNIRKASPLTKPIDLAESYFNIGICISSQGDYKRALALHQQALSLRMQSHLSDHSSLAASFNSTAVCYQRMGLYQEALTFYEQAAFHYKNSSSISRLELASVHSNIATCTSTLGNYKKAFSEYLEALKTYEIELPSKHPTLAKCYCNIGECCRELSKHELAIKYHRKSLDILESVLPENSLDFAIGYGSLGLCYSGLAQHEDALTFLRKGLKIREANFPPNHQEVALSHANIGSCYISMGLYQHALGFCQNALDKYKASLSVNHPLLATPYNNIGLCYYKLGLSEKALKFYKKAIKIYKKVKLFNRVDSAICYRNIATCYRALGKPKKAQAYFKKAQELRASNPEA